MGVVAQCPRAKSDWAVRRFDATNYQFVELSPSVLVNANLSVCLSVRKAYIFEHFPMVDLYARYR